MIYNAKFKDNLRVVQWTGDNYDEVCKFIGYTPIVSKGRIAIGPSWDCLLLPIGGYIIKDKFNEIYARLEEHFNRDYEIIE